jgi:sn-1 stearoyl-lipid 9-desaturase
MKKENSKILYDFVFLLSIFHILAFAAFYYIELKWVALTLVIWPISHGVGLAGTFHRKLTHGGYETPVWLEYVLTVCGCLALQGGHIKWVAIHKVHHAATDRESDPHSPKDGFWWSHIGWMIKGDPALNEPALQRKYAKKLCESKFHAFLNRFWWLPSTVIAIVLFSFGGVPAVLWGIFVPVTFGLHFTWFVNSACHLWGNRTFNTKDDSRNNWWVAMLTFGEGWHNNHHGDPVRARHGIEWYQIDPSWYFILLLKKLRLAYAIKA